MDVYIYIINQQAIGYAADVCVCVHLLYMWVGGSGRYVCVWHAEVSLQPV